MLLLLYILGHIIDFYEVYLTSQQNAKCVEFISSCIKRVVGMEAYEIHLKCFSEPVGKAQEVAIALLSYNRPPSGGR